MKTEYNAGNFNYTVEEARPQNTAQEYPTSGNMEGNVCRPLISKICKGCKELKTMDEFYFNKTKNRYFSECKVCNKRRASLWNTKNKERYLLNTENHRKANPELYRQYKIKEYEKNKESYANYQKVYRSSKHGKTTRLALSRVRELAKIHATPKWLSKKQKEEMKLFYANCPEGFHVDHIVPIKGKNVRGLHVPWNLQYLTASENLKKRNKF